MKTLSQKSHDAPQEVPTTATGSEVPTHQRSLRSKLVLSLAAIFFVFLLIDEVVRQKVIEPGFSELEQAGAVRDAQRVLAALDAEVDHLQELAFRQSDRWFQPSAFLPGSDSIHPLIASEAASDAKAGSDWIARVREDGALDWLQVDSNASPSQVDTTADQLRKLVQACLPSDPTRFRGLTRLNNQSLAAFCILAVNHEQPAAAGSLASEHHVVIARELSDQQLEAIRDQTLVEFTLTLPQEIRSASDTIIRPIDRSILLAEVPVLDPHGQRLASLRIRVPREITAKAAQTTKLARNSFIFGSVAALFLLLVLLQKIIIRPLAAIREHSDRVAEVGFATKPLLLNRNDEIGQLACAFDKMVGNLRDAQNQLSQASQAAGRSEVASTVIHNVGNVLTNVNSLLDAVRAGVEGLRIGPLEKLARRLRLDRDNESMLAATPDYLEGLAGSLKCDQASIQQLLATLHDNVCHIHDVIRDQQRYTGSSIKADRVRVREIVEEAIACCRARLNEDKVLVSIGGSLATEIHTDRSLLLQTMINIIGNARQAMRDNLHRERRLTIQVETSDQFARIAFRDNGCGMSEETLRRVFDAHFTTREGGTGLGLHFCSLTLKRLQGHIHAASEGPGQGAAFVIEIPRASSASSPVLGSHYQNLQAASLTSCATTS